MSISVTILEIDRFYNLQYIIAGGQSNAIVENLTYPSR